RLQRSPLPCASSSVDGCPVRLGADAGLMWLGALIWGVARLPVSNGEYDTYLGTVKVAKGRHLWPRGPSQRPMPAPEKQVSTVRLYPPNKGVPAGRELCGPRARLDQLGWRPSDSGRAGRRRRG